MSVQLVHTDACICRLHSLTFSHRTCPLLLIVGGPVSTGGYIIVRSEGAVAPRYGYQAKDPELHRDLRRALALAERDKVEVARMLAANAIHRMRRMALVAYAPAETTATGSGLP